jgi:HK97 family phage major capsid protein
VNTVRSAMLYYLFSGNGAGEPLGIFNSGALVDRAPATNNTFAKKDMSAMAGRLFLINGSRDRVCWVAHSSMMEDIDAIEDSTSNSVVVLATQENGSIEYMKGYPVHYDDWMPQADSSGCINLVDLSAYLFFQMQGQNGEGFAINYYDQNSLTHDIWTFDARMDGQPLLRSTISRASYEKSAYVRFND